MDDKFFVGVALGMLGGAMIAANSVRARKLVNEGKEQLMERVDSMTKQTKKSKK